MLRTVQAQSEEEQLRHALEASCNTAAAAEAEADMVRQAIAESMAAIPGDIRPEAEHLGGSGAAGSGASGRATGGGMDEEEELNRALALSGLQGHEWETPPAGAHDFDMDDIDQDPELRQAIKASLAGQ